MADCATEPKVASLLPDHARNAHGNLAEQNRSVGPQRGSDTTRSAPTTLAEAASRAATTTVVVAAAPAAAAQAGGAQGFALAQKHGCTACHGLENKLVGPGFVEIAKKQGSRADALDYLSGKIRNGGSGVWGAIPMPPQSLGEADAKAIAQWLAAGAAKQ
jgi:cytochrome c